MDELVYIKKEYNKKLLRNKKAEEYFKTHTVDKCIKYLNLYNQVTEELSQLMKRYKELTGESMSREEILNGFEEA